MKRFFKNHVALIIIIIVVFAFPTSLSNQARLNMRVIVTGLAIDKKDDEFEVTAQIVKTSPGNESGGISAEVNFLSDTDKTLLGAISKLSYKAGKVSAFSHTNFLIIGEELAKTENLNSSLNYFLRDRIIKNTALVLFSEGKAGDEIKKTKDVELSVGLGLQKVYLFKERESDGIMLTVLDFLNNSSMFSKTAVASMIKLSSEDEGKQTSETQSSSGSSSSGSGEGSKQSSGGSGASGESYKYFEPVGSLVCFVDGKMCGKLEEEKEILGFMLANKNSISDDFSLENVTGGKLNGSTVGVKMEDKSVSKKIRFENGVPCLDICITVDKSEIEEIQSEFPAVGLKEKEYEAVSKALKKDISEKVSACFEKSKSFGADVFEAYELALKTKHNQTKKYFDSPKEFLEKLRVNVETKIKSLEY